MLHHAGEDERTAGLAMVKRPVSPYTRRFPGERASKGTGGQLQRDGDVEEGRCRGGIVGRAGAGEVGEWRMAVRVLVRCCVCCVKRDRVESADRP